MTATTVGWIALAAYICWVVWVFGAKVIRQYRATGDFGVRRSTSTPVRRIALPLMVAGLALVGVGTLTAAISQWIIIEPPPIVQLVGAVVFLAAAAGTVVAQLNMGRSWRIGVDPAEQTGLVTTGLFAIIRNPFFTASMTLTYALIVLAPTLPTLIGALAYTMGINLQVRLDEEPALHALHGDAYDDYVRRVGRFIPRLWSSR